MTVPEFTYIYGLYDPRTNELRYVGKANCLEERLKRHIHNRSSDPNYPKCQWIQDLLREGLVPEIRVIEKVRHKLWRRAERSAIKRFRAQGAKLLNITAGGEGFNWAEAGRSEERSEITKSLWKRPDYRRRQKAVNRKRELSPEEHKQRSEAMRKKWQDPEYRRKKTEARHRQSPVPKKTREQISNSLKRLWQDPEFREQSIEASQNANSRKKRSRSMKRTLREKREGST